MVIPLIIFLYIYWGFLFFWAIFVFIALYHMFRYSYKNLISFFIILIFLGVSGFILLFSYNHINEINWDKKVTVFSEVFDSSSPY